MGGKDKRGFHPKMCAQILDILCDRTDEKITKNINYGLEKVRDECPAKPNQICVQFLIVINKKKQSSIMWPRTKRLVFT